MHRNNPGWLADLDKVCPCLPIRMLQSYDAHTRVQLISTVETNTAEHYAQYVLRVAKERKERKFVLCAFHSSLTLIPYLALCANVCVCVCVCVRAFVCVRSFRGGTWAGADEERERERLRKCVFENDYATIAPVFLRRVCGKGQTSDELLSNL